MSQVLYQKYRPRGFDDLVGQESIVTILKNAIAKGKIGHAYIFVGPRGTGKTTTARILAKAINSPLKDGNPDLESDISKAIEAGNLMDLIEIDAASNRGIDEVRELKEKVNFAPVQAKYKTYIIDEVHMMTKEAFNALLKTLEEPPAHVVFILATTEVHKVPATILSRCQRFDFRLGSKEQVIQNIKKILDQEKVKIEDEGLDLVYESSGGSYRDSLSILELVVSGQKESEDPSTVTANEVRVILGLPDTTMVYYLLDNLIKGNSEECLNLISEISAKGIDLHQFVFVSLDVLRKALVAKLKKENLPDESGFAKALSIADLVRLITFFVEADQEIKYSSIPTLPLEMLVAKYLSVAGQEISEPVASKAGKAINSEVKLEKPVEEKKVGIVKKIGKSVEAIKDKVVKSTKEVSPDEIHAKWPEFIEKIKPYNGYFHMFLAKAHVKEMSDNRVILVVPFSFHKDRIEDPQNVSFMAKVMEEIWGYTFKIECEVDEKAYVAEDPEGVIASGKEPRRDNAPQAQTAPKSEGASVSSFKGNSEMSDRVKRLQKSISRGGIEKDKDIDPTIMSEVLDVFV